MPMRHLEVREGPYEEAQPMRLMRIAESNERRRLANSS